MQSSCLRLALKRAELTLTILLLAAGASFAQSTGAPPPGAFGNVVIGATEQLSISPKVSKYPVTFKSSTISSGSGFSILTDGCAGKTVPANSSCKITVQFAPGTTLGSRTGTLQVNDNGVGYKQSLTLTGTGVQGTATFSSGAFGNVGDTLTKKLVINAAVANFPVTFASSTVSTGSGFTSVVDGCAGTTVQPGSTCSITVQFAPGTTTGSKTGTLQVNDNAVGFPQSLALTGTGVQGTATLSAGAFGNVGAGLTKQLVIKAAVANFPVTFTSSTVSTGAGFTRVTDGCAGTTVQPGSTCSISVQFAPGTTTGTKTATLQVNDNAAGFKQLIALTGTGVQAKVNNNSNTNGKNNTKPAAPKKSKKK